MRVRKKNQINRLLKMNRLIRECVKFFDTMKQPLRATLLNCDNYLDFGFSMRVEMMHEEFEIHEVLETAYNQLDICFSTTPVAHSKRRNTKRTAHLIVIHRHLIINIPYQRNSHLCCIISPQHITDEMSLDLHLYHLQRAS